MHGASVCRSKRSRSKRRSSRHRTPASPAQAARSPSPRQHSPLQRSPLRPSPPRRSPAQRAATPPQPRFPSPAPTRPARPRCAAAACVRPLARHSAAMHEASPAALCHLHAGPAGHCCPGCQGCQVLGCPEVANLHSSQGGVWAWSLQLEPWLRVSNRNIHPEPQCACAGGARAGGRPPQHRRLPGRAPRWAAGSPCPPSPPTPGSRRSGRRPAPCCTRAPRRPTGTPARPAPQQRRPRQQPCLLSHPHGPLHLPRPLPRPGQRAGLPRRPGPPRRPPPRRALWHLLRSAAPQPVAAAAQHVACTCCQLAHRSRAAAHPRAATRAAAGLMRLRAQPSEEGEILPEDGELEELAAVAKPEPAPDPQPGTRSAGPAGRHPRGPHSGPSRDLLQPPRRRESYPQVSKGAAWCLRQVAPQSPGPGPGSAAALRRRGCCTSWAWAGALARLSGNPTSAAVGSQKPGRPASCRVTMSAGPGQPGLPLCHSRWSMHVSQQAQAWVLSRILDGGPPRTATHTRTSALARPATGLWPTGPGHPARDHRAGVKRPAGASPPAGAATTAPATAGGMTACPGLGHERGPAQAACLPAGVRGMPRARAPGSAEGSAAGWLTGWLASLCHLIDVLGGATKRTMRVHLHVRLG